MTRLLVLLILALLAPQVLAIVDIKNANYSNTWVDFNLPAKEPSAELKLERTYNSRTLFNGIFGFGWCTNFETSLTITAEGNLKRTLCGAGAEEVFIAAPLTRQDVESVIDAIIRKKRANETSYRNDLHYRELREELLEYDDKRTVLAREMGLLEKPIEGKKYVVPPARPWTVVEQGKARKVAPLYSAEMVFQDGSFHLKREDGSQEQFDRQGRLLRVVDKAGYALKLSYLDNGLLKRVSDGKGRSLLFEYYANRKVWRVIASNGTKAEYQYSNQDDLAYSISSQRFATAYTYDGLHNIVKIVFTDGSRIRIQYDTNNDWVTGFIDRDNCRENYTYEVDPKDTKGHFWSTVTKTCGKHVVACSRYEFFYRRNQTGDYELEKVESTELSFPAKAERSESAASSGLPKECKRD